ncbi:plasmid replication protein RepB [Aeromonas salmonicida]|uniref:plasmid replication protein RepB n=1 Tax=Aeromonas TaxID=642 RepID=UPI000B404FCD|nr:plasmid replication protein RepB [Aeromonas salmonicida]ARW85404.1 plasmid replication protein RepB [Aeromonas salmonicida]
MKELQAKWVFEQGGFSKALVACAPMGTGYHLHLVKFGRQSGTELIELQRGGPREFKTIDAAVQTAKNIGFRRVEVDMSGMRD